jgi:Fic family protein
MKLLPIEEIQINYEKIKEIDYIVKSIYRLIIFSRHHEDDDLLNNFFNGMHELTELLSIKNAQMEAQNEEEAKEYLKNMRIALNFIVEEIKANRNFENEVQLFQLFRLVSPETHAEHPNHYRHSLVQIGSYVCPDQSEVPMLVSDLFYRMQSISNPIIRAIYFHHELIRIHPFLDGNGRVTRIAKNWMLMYELYPPIFINDVSQKREYITKLGNSFRELNNSQNVWNGFTAQFFEQELCRLLINAKGLYDVVNQIGIERGKNV